MYSEVTDPPPAYLIILLLCILSTELRHAKKRTTSVRVRSGARRRVMKVQFLCTRWTAAARRLDGRISRDDASRGYGGVVRTRMCYPTSHPAG